MTTNILEIYILKIFTNCFPTMIYFGQNNEEYLEEMSIEIKKEKWEKIIYQQIYYLLVERLCLTDLQT